MEDLKSHRQKLAARFTCAVLAALTFATAACGGRDQETNSNLQLLPLPDYSQSQDMTDIYATGACAHRQSLSLAVSLKNASGRALVYRADNPLTDPGYLKELADRFGMFVASTPEAVKDDSGSSSGAKLSGERGTISIDDEMEYFSFTSSSREDLDVSSISDKKAQTIAEDFLREVGLLPDAKLRATVKRYPYYLDVRFEPQDMKIALGEPTIEFSIGGDGQVQYLFYAWRDLRSLGEYPIISEADALERLRRCEGYISEGSPYPQIEITDVGLVYIGVPVGPAFDYLVPAYRFTTSEDVPGLLWEAWVPAIPDEYYETSAAPPQTSGS